MSTSIITVVEAIASASVPTSAGIIAYVKWRKNADENRYQREQAATTAANQAAVAARTEEQVMRDRLLAEKDATIARLELMLQSEQAANTRLQNMLLNRPASPLVPPALGGAQHDGQ